MGRGGKRNTEPLRISPHDPATQGQTIRLDAKIEIFGNRDRVDRCDHGALRREVPDFATQRRPFEHDLPPPYSSSAMILFHPITTTRAPPSSMETGIEAARRRHASIGD